MNTSTIPTSITTPSTRGVPARRRFVGIVTEPQTYRNVVYLLLGLPLGTVRSRLHYAKRALRAAIEADERPKGHQGRSA